MAENHLDRAIARRLQRDKQNFDSASAARSSLKPAEQPDAEARMIDIERVRPNPKQARTDFPAESIAELAASLRRDGQLQPILVRPSHNARPQDASNTSASTWGESERDEPQEFEIVMGERRWRAARSIGLTQVRATVRQVNDAEMLRLSLVENIQREDLNAVDRARTLLQLKASSPDLRWHDIALDLGLSRQSINNLVALLKLPQDIQDDIRAGHLNEKHGRALRQLDGEAQKQLSERIKAGQINGEQALAQARDLRGLGKGTLHSQRPETKTSEAAASLYAMRSALELLQSAHKTLPLELADEEKHQLQDRIASGRKYLDDMQAALSALD